MKLHLASRLVEIAAKLQGAPTATEKMESLCEVKEMAISEGEPEVALYLLHAVSDQSPGGVQSDDLEKRFVEKIEKTANFRVGRFFVFLCAFAKMRGALRSFFVIFPGGGRSLYVRSSPILLPDFAR